MLGKIKLTFESDVHKYTLHAQERMAVRHITNSEICEAVLGEVSEIIEDYPDDKYAPSYLIYGQTKQYRILHVLTNIQGVVITVYEPDTQKWHNDLKTRRK